MARLPERIVDGDLLLRRWRVEDAALQERVVTESLEHLRPWMPWIAHEPQPIEQRRDTLAAWEREWEAGGDAYLALFHRDEIAGSAGLHRRRGPGVLEIGYWLHPAFTGRGIMTAAVRLLTGAALSVDGIDRVDICHDVANARSGAIPARLGFVMTEEAPNREPGPADTGTDRVWSMTRAAWRLVSSDA
jgi:RimJ/RimL family protein N-acetyltransferase